MKADAIRSLQINQHRPDITQAELMREQVAQLAEMNENLVMIAASLARIEPPLIAAPLEKPQVSLGAHPSKKSR